MDLITTRSAEGIQSLIDRLPTRDLRMTESLRSYYTELITIQSAVSYKDEEGTKINYA
jgi:hypothetical protein